VNLSNIMKELTRSSRGVIPNKSVSGRHLKVHSVMYEDDSGKELPPLVYVRDCSSNGTYIRRLGDGEAHRLAKSEDAILLNDGDLLVLGDHTYAVFRIMAEQAAWVGLNNEQKAETEASAEFLMAVLTDVDFQRQVQDYQSATGDWRTWCGVSGLSFSNKTTIGLQSCPDRTGRRPVDRY
jgi:hypothetical protein